MTFGDRTYSLHDIFQGVQTHISRSVRHLGVHGHGNTLAESGEDQRPFSANKRQLDRRKCEDSTDNSWEVDDEVLLICVAHGSPTLVDIVA